MLRNAAYLCSECGAKDLCLGAGLGIDQLSRLEGISTARTQKRAGHPLYNQGDTFSTVFTVVSGTSKSVARLPGNKLAVTGIALRGDILGFTGIASGAIPETLVPQEDSIFCVIPYRYLTQRIQSDPLIGIQFHKAMARTTLQQQSARLLISGTKADRKIRGFLFWFMHQLALRDQYATEFRLPISRRDLANFLGLRLETVSRAFARLSSLGIVKTHGRHIHVLDHAALQD